MEKRYASEADEVFHSFGKAAHYAQVFEADVINILLLVGATSGEAMYQEELLDLEGILSKKTLGQLLDRISCRRMNKREFTTCRSRKMQRV